MATTLTRPNGIPAEVVACTDKQLRALLATPYAPHATAELAFREANAEALAKAEAEELANRMATLTSEGTTIMGIKVTYEELLHLATITPKKFYELSEGSIIRRMRAEVTTALAGIQSLEAHALKQAIAELAE